MSRRVIHRVSVSIAGFAFAASIAFSAAPAIAAEPSLQQVYQAAEVGNYREAQSMMDQVLRDHPRSAKAHYVEAELLAKQGRIAEARSELQTAETLQPGLPFARSASVQELKDRLAARSAISPNRYVAAPAAAAPSFPWGLVFVGLILIAALMFFVRRSRSQSVMPAAAGYGSQFGTAAQPYPYGGPGPMPGSGGMGSGILGNLATGAAVGAGIVAGESLMHRMLDGGHPSQQVVQPNEQWNDAPSQYDMGGDDFGVNDASSWGDDAGGGSDWS